MYPKTYLRGLNDLVSSRSDISSTCRAVNNHPDPLEYPKTLEASDICSRE
jgi:hypothetical protein